MIGSDVIAFWTQLFSTEGFVPRWLCGQWTGFHGWLTIVGNLGITLAYYSIPGALLFLLWRKRVVIGAEFRLLLLLFGTFIMACGTTHLLEAIIFWHPIYRLATLLDAVTAAVSLFTMVVLIRLLSHLTSLRTPKQMELEVAARTEALKDARADLERSNERFQAMLDNNLMGVIIADMDDGRILHGNPAFYALLGYPDGTPLNWKQITPAHYAEQDQYLVQRIKETGKTPVFEKQYRHKEGHPVDILLCAALLPHSENQVAGFMVDISERKANLQALKEREEEVRKLNEALEAKVQVRTQELRALNQELVNQNDQLEAFSYSVSHDLKAPIRRIQNYVGVLLEDCESELSDECKAHLARITDNTEYMSRLTADLLTLCRTNQAHVNPAPLDIAPLLHEIGATHQRHYADKQATLTTPDRLYVLADPGLLTIALTNVLENAFKFSQRRDQPVITVSELPADTLHPNMTGICIADNGCGFDMANVEAVMKPFQRLQADYEGTGIGLTIVKRVMTAHAGQLEIDSAPGDGTRVTLWFPNPNDLEAARKAIEREL